MRVTIGERLGLRRDTKIMRPSPIREAVPQWVEPELAGPVLRLEDCPSSPHHSPYESLEISEEEPGPPRVRGEMVWIKKDVAILKIEGHPELTPDEYSSNRRR